MKFINQHRPECAAQICFILSETASPDEIELLTHSGLTPWSGSGLNSIQPSNTKSELAPKQSA
jgi:hypothetical protein